MGIIAAIAAVLVSYRFLQIPDVIRVAHLEFLLFSDSPL